MDSKTVDTGPAAWRKGRAAKLIAIAAVGGGVGLGAGWLFAEYALTDLFAVWRWSDLVAAVIAVMLAAAGATLLFATRSRPALAVALRTDDPVGAGEPSDLRRQGFLLVLAGVLLAAVPVAALFGNPRPALVFVAVLIVFAVQAWLNLRLWREGDELIRRTVVETAALCFWPCQAALFVWAVAERLGFVPGLSSWDLLTLLMGAYLVCSMIVGLRRGLG